MTTIKMKSGKVYTGICNGKNYNGTYYLNRPANGFITVDGEGSPRKSIEIIANNVESISKTTANPDVNEICPKCGSRCFGDCGK